MKKFFVFIGIVCYLAVIKSIASPINTISLQLEEFKVALDDKTNAEINWMTTENMVSEQFVVEKSLNANIFFPIDKIHATEAKRVFKSLDRKVAFGASYYRLKHISETGEVSYSLTIQINKPLPLAFELAPDVDASDIINLDLDDTGVEKVEILHYSTGEKMKEYALSGQKHIQLNVQGLENGVYWLRIKYANKRQSIRFEKS